MELSAEEIAKILRYFGLNEALRSDKSQEALRAALEHALNEWPSKPGEMRVLWTFSDRLIAVSWSEDGDRYERGVWEIPYTMGEGGMYQFGAAVAVDEIQLYEPKMQESLRSGQNGRFQETLTQALTLVLRSPASSAAARSKSKDA